MGARGRGRLTVVPAPASLPPVRAARALALAPTELGFLDLVELFCSLRILEAWTELRSLLHDDARLESIAARGVAGPEATIEAMRFAASGAAYTVRDFEIEALGEQAVLARASISREESTVSVVTSVHSVISGRGGLIWRSRIVPNREEAERILGGGPRARHVRPRQLLFSKLLRASVGCAFCVSSARS